MKLPVPSAGMSRIRFDELVYTSQPRQAGHPNEYICDVPNPSVVAWQAKRYWGMAPQ